MGSVLEVGCALFLEAHIRLMYQRCALQGVPGALVPQIMMRGATQIVVDKRNRGAQGLIVARVPVRQ